MTQNSARKKSGSNKILMTVLTNHLSASKLSEKKFPNSQSPSPLVQKITGEPSGYKSSGVSSHRAKNLNLHLTNLGGNIVS